MATNSTKTDLAFIEQCQIAFQNAEENSVIKAQLETVGYDSTKMAEGQALLETAQAKYDTQKKADADKKIAYQQYADKESELKKLYSSHHKRAKIQFAENKAIIIKLDLVKSIPSKYVDWLQAVTTFYTEVLADSDIQAELAQLKVSLEDLTAAQALIAPLEESYGKYKNTVGIAEESTKEKKQEFTNLDIWMRKFYKVAGVALEDNPQLLESLGKSIKS